tara:strand:+ start:805 stop:1125 length:321 start_codon:yes stop_codon:yes gene_type:complete
MKSYNKKEKSAARDTSCTTDCQCWKPDGTSWTKNIRCSPCKSPDDCCSNACNQEWGGRVAPMGKDDGLLRFGGLKDIELDWGKISKYSAIALVLSASIFVVYRQVK